jgi:hypothetical protein
VSPRTDKDQLFRHEALERLDDIDELDRLVTVTHPRAWLALGAVAALIIMALVWASAGRLETTVSAQGMLLTGGRTLRVATAADGRLTSMLVDVGDRVTAGQTVAVVTSAAEQSGTRPGLPVTSPYAGVVTSLQAYPGQYLAAGAPLLSVEPAGEPLVATLYLPIDEGKKVKAGQQVQIVPASVAVDEYGYLLGRVTYVAGTASTPESMQAVLQNEFLVQQFASGGPVVRVQASLTRDPGTPSGYAWSSSDGPPERISTGSSCSARVVLSRAAPITYAFPALGRVFGGAE